MNILAIFQPKVIPPGERTAKEELMLQRISVLQYVYNSVALLATLTYIYFWVNPLTRQNALTLQFISVVLVIIYALTLLRGLSYHLRARSILFIFYTLAIFSLTQQGIAGSGPLFMVAFIMLAALLYTLKAGITAAVFCLLTLIGFGAVIQSGAVGVPPMEQQFLSGSFSAWVMKAAFLMAVAAVLVSSSTKLLNGLRDAIEQQHFVAQEVEKDREKLNASIEMRTRDLQRRLLQIRTAVEIDHAIGEVRNPQVLLDNVVKLMKERFELYYVGVFLIDERGEYAVLRAGSGSAGEAMMAQGHRLQVGGASMIGWATSQQKARIALDTGAEAVRFNNPFLPDTRSELAIPILFQGKSLGAITIQSTKPDAFDQDDVLVYQGIAESLATALENARLLEDTQRNLEEIQALNRNYLSAGWGEAAKSLQISYEYVNPNAPKSSTANKIHYPLTLRDQTLGEMTLENNSGNFSAEDMEFIDAVATQTALALENARLIQETQQKAMAEEKLNEMTAMFTRSISVQDILKTAVKELGQLPAVNEVSIQLRPGEDSSQEVQR